jgi:hypothetical protein
LTRKAKKKRYDFLAKKYDALTPQTDALIVLRSQTIDQDGVMCDVIKRWAKKYPDRWVLCSVADDSLSEHKEFDRFYKISRAPSLLPWKLMRRASLRAESWRSQSTYNSSAFFGLAALLLVNVVSILALLWKLPNDRRTILQVAEYQSANEARRADVANNAKFAAMVAEARNRIVAAVRDKKLKATPVDFSFWIPFDGGMHLVASTRQFNLPPFWRIDLNSVIGCAYVYKGIAKSTNNFNGPMFVNKIDHLPATSILATPPDRRTQDPFNSVTCFSYKEDSSGVEVAACVDTMEKDGMDINREEVQALFREECRRLYDASWKLILAGQLRPLDRQGGVNVDGPIDRSDSGRL